MEGRLDLDRPLGEIVPLPNPSDAAARTITARHVLSHTSGWRNWRFARDQLLTADFAPGSRFSYSGEGYYFLQRVVERLTGQGLLRLTRQRIFEPLGMRHSSFMWQPELDAARAEPHSSRGALIESFNAKMSRGFRAAAAAAGKSMDDWTHDDAERALPSVNKDLPIFPNFLLPNSAASLLTTATDYGVFLNHLLDAPSGRAVLERMTTVQITINEAVAWGLGVGLQSAGAPDRFWHWGDNPGFKNFVIGDLAARRAIVVFTNGEKGRAVYERIIRQRRGADEPAFLWV
jgi:CubicO group peptidase (beta-lactamase class C family)